MGREVLKRAKIWKLSPFLTCDHIWLAQLRPVKKRLLLIRSEKVWFKRNLGLGGWSQKGGTQLWGQSRLHKTQKGGRKKKNKKQKNDNSGDSGYLTCTQWWSTYLVCRLSNTKECVFVFVWSTGPVVLTFQKSVNTIWRFLPKGSGGLVLVTGLGSCGNWKWWVMKLPWSSCTVIGPWMSLIDSWFGKGLQV